MADEEKIAIKNERNLNGCGETAKDADEIISAPAAIEFSEEAIKEATSEEYLGYESNDLASVATQDFNRTTDFSNFGQEPEDSPTTDTINADDGKNNLSFPNQARTTTTDIESTGRDYSSSEHYEKLKAMGIVDLVAGELIEMFDKGQMHFNEIDEKTWEMIKGLKADQCAFVLRRFREANLMGIRSVAAYLTSLLKSFKERLRQLGPLGAIAQPIITTPNVDGVQALLDRTGYALEVTIGQRKYGDPPPDWGDAPMPGPGCEVYIGKIPRDIFEDELVLLFEEFGKIYDLRLMMDSISGCSKGYAFVTYVDRQSATAAIAKYEGHEIRKGKRLRVNVSISNTRIFVGNIPKSKGKDEIFEELKKIPGFENVTRVIVYPTPDDPERKPNRGFCFVDFPDHKSASQAKRRFDAGRLRVWDCDLIGGWAEPQEEPNATTMSRVKVVYIRPLKEFVTEEQLKEYFTECGAVERVKKVKDFGFIHFTEREGAMRAIETYNGNEVFGVRVDLSLARPRGEKKKRYDPSIGAFVSDNRGRGAKPLFGRGGRGNWSRGRGGGGSSRFGGGSPMRRGGVDGVSNGGYDYSAGGYAQTYGEEGSAWCGQAYAGYYDEPGPAPLNQEPPSQGGFGSYSPMTGRGAAEFLNPNVASGGGYWAGVGETGARGAVKRNANELGDTWLPMAKRNRGSGGTWAAMPNSASSSMPSQPDWSEDNFADNNSFL